MPSKRKIKPQILPNTDTYEYLLSIRGKNYCVSICNQCSVKLYNESWKRRDKSIYKHWKGLITGKHEFSIGKAITFNWKRIKTSVPCDFCKGGKRIEDFL